MFVYVDESGDPGIKGKQGSSKYFVITAVIFDSQSEVTKCDQEIDKLRLQLGLGKQEFKFNKCSRHVRVAFLRGMDKFAFSYLSFVLNKAKLTGEGFKHKKSFYKYPTQLLFQNAKKYLKEATIIIDGSGDKEFRLQLQSYLRNTVTNPDGSSPFASIKINSSHNNNLLQLADMVCGATVTKKCTNSVMA